MAIRGSALRTFHLAVGLAGLLALRLPAQSPMTPDELKKLLSDAAATAHTIARPGAKYDDVQQRAKALIAEFGRHNAEPCDYPQGQPEMCANYDRERLDLNLRLSDIQKEMKVVDAPIRAARVHFAELMTRLRTAEYPPALLPQKSQLIKCANLNGVAESAACLSRVQHRDPLQ